MRCTRSGASAELAGIPPSGGMATVRTVGQTVLFKRLQLQRKWPSRQVEAASWLRI
jgi:hypothetical protein